MMKPAQLFSLLFLTLTGLTEARQELSLGAPFADGAVLQREMKLPVWGWSEPGVKVSVEFAGQRKEATAGEGGKWMLELEPLKASAEPAEMKVSESGGTAMTVKDILVGEVWMASGQSNMQWVAAKCDVGQILMKQIAARVAAGEEKEPVIREAKVTDFYATLHPIEHATVVWAPGDGEMSAVSYAFAYQLHRELGVPIGILNCSFSQTSIQAWTPREGFAGGEDDYTKAIYRKILETDPATAEHKAAWGKFYQDIEATLAANKQRVAKGGAALDISTKTPGNMSDNRDASWLFNARLNPMIPYAIKGCIWNQGYANMNDGLVYYNNLHSMIRGWRQLWARPELPVIFHQFYCPGQNGPWDNSPNIGSTAEMRLGTWLARDIPHTAMASQIDITGAIHYGNKSLPGQRLALQALKNQYGKDIAADGPMFKSYEVKGEQLIVTLEHADGLQIAETGTNSKSGLAVPTLIPDGMDQVKLFYLAGEDRVWHPAQAEIDGGKIIVTSTQVKSPRGVSYATGGVGNQPNIYNKAMLPTTPFIHFDNKPVTSGTWPDNPIKVAGVVPDPTAGSLLETHRRVPLLSSQFVDNAVLQADVPVTVWGSADEIWGAGIKGERVVRFSFDGKEHVIIATPGMKEWSVTLPPMKAGGKTYTLHARLEINGELAAERKAENVVFGDVYYVAIPADLKFGPAEKPAGIVRMMTRKAKGSVASSPRRFSVSTSTSPVKDNRFASLWEDASGAGAALGKRLSAGSDRPLGIILMQTAKEKGKPDASLKQWIAAGCLNMAPSLMEDYRELGGMLPGNEFHEANVRRYMADWKAYWDKYVPEMIATRRVPDGVPWGEIPSMASSVSTTAAQTHNVLVESFSPASLKGIVFISNQDMVAEDGGALFGERMSALANCMKKGFGGADVPFHYTIPCKALAPNITRPDAIKGASQAIEISAWNDSPEILGKIGVTPK